MGDSDGLSYDMTGGNDLINEMLRWLEAGSSVVIERDGKRVARLVPYVDPPEAGAEADGEIEINVTD